MQAKELSRLLAQRALDVARHLLPSGVVKGRDYCAGDVTGGSGYSLKVCIEGEKAGLWSDFASGDGGDLLDLWCQSRNLSLFKAIEEATRYCGITPVSFVSKTPVKCRKSVCKLDDLPSISDNVLDYLINVRKLIGITIEDYRIYSAGDEVAFPYICDGSVLFVKYMKLGRPNGKKIMRVEPNCEPCLFGWHLIPDTARTVTICEGEIDCMSLYQYGIPALSVPLGAGTGGKHDWLANEFDHLAIFDTIYLCFDDDEAGQSAVSDLVERLGRHRVKIILLPEKDPNACLQIGLDIQPFFDNAKSLDPEELRSADLFRDKTWEELNPSGGKAIGYESPWDKAQGKILFRPDELSIWTGINGHGKSQFLGHVMLGMMQQGARICIASLELSGPRMLARLTRQVAALRSPSREFMDGIFDWYTDKLWLFDLLGNAKSKRLMDVFLYARQRYGVDVFVIDSLMKLDISEDDYKSQKAFIEQLCDFKNQHKCQIHIVVHPRKGADESKAPSKLDNKGTGAISDLADNCFTIWRNKEKERVAQWKEDGLQVTDDLIQKLDMPDTVWACDKQRHGEWEGKTWFWFDRDSLQYLESDTQKPRPVIEWSRIT